MRNHRRTSARVSKHLLPDNSSPSEPPEPFDPADALEALHTELVQLEAFAHAAGEAVTHLPHTTDPKQRRDFTRLYALVSKVATDAATTATHGDQLIAALSAHLDARRSTHPDDLDS